MAYEEIVQQYYVGFYGRPADEEGLEFWTNQLEDAGGDFSAIQDSFANSQEYRDFVLIDQGAARSYEDLVNFIYNNLFGRDAEPEGLEFYVSRLESGEYSLIDIVKRIIDGAQNGDLEAFNNKVEVADYFTSQLDGTPYTRDDILDARDLLADVTDDPGSVTEGFAAADALFAEQASQIFTLKEVWVDGEPEVLPVTEVYWGYPMCSDCQDGPEGIPLDELVAFVTTITGLDLEELGLIDDDGSGPFDNVTSLTLSNPLSSETIGDATSGEVEVDDGLGAGAGNVQLTIQYVDGTVMSFDAEPLLGEQYFNFLTNLLFYETDEGQLKSRLFEKVIVDGVEATEDYMVPIVLTTNQNNGGTYEPGWTSFGNDTIVVGRLELLHGAYIDAGGGYDILEVDAKGVFAQPLELLNIEEVRVENLPNVYTAEKAVYTYTNEDGVCVTGECLPTYEGWSAQTDPNYSVRYVSYTTYPDHIAIIDEDQGIRDSYLDLSRATSIQKLVITEGNDIGVDEGSLTIVGIRNGATARFEGGFEEDVTLHYGQGITGELDVELAIGDIYSDINLLHNAAVLNVDSQGIENHMHAFFAGGSISRMIVTGTGAFGVEEDLSDGFNADRPAIIDASANTGGLDVTLNGHYNVSIKGTEAYDEITAENSGDVIIEAYDGDNVIDVDGSEIVDITSGDGADEISAENGVIVTIAAGDGDNQIDVDGSATVNIAVGAGADQISAENGKTVTIAAGDGDNVVNTSGSRTAMVNTGSGNDTITSTGNGSVTINAGDGDNAIVASGASIDVTAGAGNDSLVIAGTEGDGQTTTTTTGAAPNLVLVLDGSGSMFWQTPTNAQAQADAVDDLLDSLPADTAVYVVYSATGGGVWASKADASQIANGLAGGTVSGTWSTQGFVAEVQDAFTSLGGTYNVGGQNNVIFITDGANSTLSDAGSGQTGLADWEAFLSSNQIVSNAIGIGATSARDIQSIDEFAYDGINNVDIDGIVSPTSAELGALVTGLADTIVVGGAGNAAQIQIDLGAGDNVIHLGDNDELDQGITAQEGSSISGQNITLKVEAASDLQAAELSGITKVIMEDDDGNSDPMLTLTAEQFEAIGGANFNVEGSVFHTHAFVKIIVGAGQNVSLTDLGVDDLPRGIDLYIEIQDGATVTMTAEQLHTHVAQNGVILANDNNTDYVNGKVIITGGGFDFDPFNTSDTVKTVIDGTVYYGGSLSDDFMVGGDWYNVTVRSLVDGYNRPDDDPAKVFITLDSTGTETLVQGALATWHWNLEIVGDQDIEFTGPIELGMNAGAPANPFTIDFSALEGEVINFTVDNFELLAQGGGIYGNADNGYASEVLIHIAADDYVEEGPESNGFGWDEEDAEALVSSGVERYIVTQIDGPTAAGSLGSTATIVLCDTAQDIEVFGLRGNYNDALVIVNAAWGLAFELQGGTTAKADGPTGTANVGRLYVDYEWDGADAVVSLVHSVEGDVRPIYAAGIDIDNADSITINAEGPAAIIEYIAGDSLETLDVNADGDVIFDLDTDLPTSLTMIDASGVVGTFTASIDGNPTGNPDDYMDGAFTFVGAQGGSFLTLDDLPPTGDDAPAYVIDGGVGGVELTIDGGPTGVDLSEATLTNITGVVLKDDARLTIQMEDADLIGAGNFTLAEGADNATLNLVGLSDELFALANYEEGISISLTLADDPVVTLHPDTDLTGISELVIPEGTTLNIELEQLIQLAHEGGSIEGKGTLNITDASQDLFDAMLAAIQAGENYGLTFGEDVIQGTFELVSDFTLPELLGSLSGIEDLVSGFTYLIGGYTFTVPEIDWLDGTSVIGEAGSTITFTDPAEPILSQIDASGFDVDFLKVLNILVDDNNVDYMFDGLPERVTKIIYDDFGYVIGRTQYVVIEDGVTVPGDLSFNDYGLDTEVTTLNVTFEGGGLLDGDLIVSTVTKGEPTEDGDVSLIPLYLQELNIVSAGSEETENLVTGETANVITGNITPLAFLPNFGASRDNNLKEVNITADNELIIEGAVIFNSHGEDDDWKPVDDITANDDTDAVVTLNIEGEADVTIGQINVEDADVGTLIINHTGTGTLYVTGTSPAIEADDTDAIYFKGSGDIVLGSEDNDYWGIDSWENDDEALSLIDATEYSGTLTMNDITDINDDDFTFYAGPGVVTATIDDSTLDADWPSPEEAPGWTFDFSEAAAGSSLTFEDNNWWEGELNIDMGANAVLYIMEDTDWTGIDLTYAGTQAIVLGDEVTLTLTAEQASGLNIIAGEDTDDDGDYGVVNIVDLGDDPVDLSGIAEEIAGVVTLEDDDVTLDVATDLGFFTVQLDDIDGTDVSLAGQTIRFQTVAQAERDIRVGENFYGDEYDNDDDPSTPDIFDTDINSSTNVVWLFTDIDASVDTSGYDPEIGRLWLMDALIDGEGGDVENLFTTLPYSIVRAEFEDPSFLDALLSSAGVDRIFEAVSFMQLGDLTFSDVGIAPEEHVASLTMRLGGQVTIGNIILDDEVSDPLFDPESVEFSTLTIVSYRALSDEHFMAAEEYVNDNDGTNEPGEHVLPANLNTVGDIYIGTANGIDLLDVRLDTLGDSTVYEGSDDTDMELWGANLETGTITYDSEEPGSIATLTVSGENDIDIASVNTDDADVLAVNVVYDGFTATLTAPGASPAFQVNATEGLVFKTTYQDQERNGVDDPITILGSEGNAGVVGDELSLIDASGYVGDLDLGIIALVDGTDDEAFDYNGNGDIDDDDYECADIAFKLIGNGVENTTWATLGTANGFTPTLETGSTWRFEDVNLTITDDVVFEDGAILEFKNVNLVIDDDVDLSRVTINWIGYNDVAVLEDKSLTLSVEQVLALEGNNDPSDDVVDYAPIDIVGPGTTKVVGDHTVEEPYDYSDVDDPTFALGEHLRTVGVDVSGVTVDEEEDAYGGLGLFLESALIYSDSDDDYTERVGHVVTGSAEDDLLLGSLDLDTSDDQYDDTFMGGAGIDKLVGFGGSDTYIVDADTDIIFGLEADDPEDSGEDWFSQDVLVVEEGATAYGFIYDEFYATAETINDGTAYLIGRGGEDTYIDVSLAGGTEGFTLIGSASLGEDFSDDGDFFDWNLATAEELALGQGGDGGSRLIGSAKDDVIMGGNDVYSSGIDIMTGNGGADTFVFNQSISDPADLTIGEADPAAADYEQMEVTAAEGEVTTPALVVSYRLNGTTTAVNVDISAVDETDAGALAIAIAARLNQIDGIIAAVDTTTSYYINVEGEDGNAIEILGVGAVPSFELGTIALTETSDSDVDDVEQVTVLTVELPDGVTTATAGEKYNLTIELRNGTDIVTDTYEATGTEDAEALRNALLLALQTQLTAAGDPIDATAVGDGTTTPFGIELEGVADEGGFDVTNFSASGSFEGSGASDILAGTDDDLAKADIITDFNQYGDDVIDLNLVDGVGGASGNYQYDEEMADYATAYSTANTVLDGDIIYYFTSIEAAEGASYLEEGVLEAGDTVGLLFFDANNDGDADGVVALIGVDETMFSAGDIIA